MSLKGKKFNECPVCRLGELLVVKDVKFGVFSIMCDDCEAEWENPSDALVGGSKAILGNEKPVKDASMEEILKLGWTQFLKGDYYPE